MRKSWLPAYIALGVTWGCSFIFIELGLEFLTPFGVAFVRCALGAITLLIIVKVRKIALPKDKSTWRKLWIVALMLNVVPGILFAFAQQYVTSVVAGIINATTPLMTMVFMLLLFREQKLKSEQIIGLLIGATGVMVVLGIWKGIGDNQLIGVVALLLAVSCYGYSFPYTTRKILPLGLKPEAAATIQLCMAAITLLPLYLFDGIAEENYRLTPLLAVLALGVLGSGFAYIWNFSIIAAAGGSIASTVTYVTPVVAVIVGWIFLGEQITWHEPIGAVFVILGAAMTQGRLKRKVVSK
ncbi:MAG: DMT family transporter [Candidatus Nanopelagicus sp.]|jgi:Permeases of the drug/metabolite transporter (DMT) superfamily